MCICTSANTQCRYAHAAWALHTLHMHVKFTLHTPCTRTPNMPYTCHKPVLHKLHMHCILATRVPYIGSTLSTCTHSWMHRHIVLHARTPQAQCTYSVCTHDVCVVHTRNTQAAHMPLICITDATYVTNTSMLQACQRHTVCILHANRMPHMHECMPHSYCIYCLHTSVMHTAHTYSACMHIIPIYAGYLLLHVYFIQNTCKHFPWMHKLMLHSHKPFTCILHTSILHPHTMPLASRTCVSLLCAFRMCFCACCLCLQHAWCQYSCLEHVLVQLLACGMPVPGMQECSGCACMWVACMHAACGMHVCVVCIHVAHRHAWGGV